MFAFADGEKRAVQQEMCLDDSRMVEDTDGAQYLQYSIPIGDPALDSRRVAGRPFGLVARPLPTDSRRSQ